jgi:DNA-binding transcriptional regulator LsrR (DeoR family)
LATKEEKEVARQQRDSLIQLTTDMKYVRLAVDKNEQNQKEVNQSMLSLHRKTDERLDKIEKEIISAKGKAKGLAIGAALGGGASGAGLITMITKFLGGGG